uniref:Transposase n=1 Tax=Angiostrongylus cantonensis TaxID=6313 RepID=A0A0K0DEW6_ANGCA
MSRNDSVQRRCQRSSSRSRDGNYHQHAYDDVTSRVGDTMTQRCADEKRCRWPIKVQVAGNWPVTDRSQSVHV